MSNSTTIPLFLPACPTSHPSMTATASAWASAVDTEAAPVGTDSTAISTPVSVRSRAAVCWAEVPALSQILAKS
jgi:hypothetical protein